MWAEENEEIRAVSGEMRFSAVTFVITHRAEPEKTTFGCTWVARKNPIFLQYRLQYSSSFFVHENQIEVEIMEVNIQSSDLSVASQYLSFFLKNVQSCRLESAQRILSRFLLFIVKFKRRGLITSHLRDSGILSSIISQLERVKKSNSNFQKLKSLLISMIFLSIEHRHVHSFFASLSPATLAALFCSIDSRLESLVLAAYKVSCSSLNSLRAIQDWILQSNAVPNNLIAGNYSM